MWLDNQYPENSWSRFESRALKTSSGRAKPKKNMAEKEKPCGFRSDSPLKFFFLYRTNHSQTIARKVRDNIIAHIIFITRKINTCMLFLGSHFSSELKSKVVYSQKNCGESIYFGKMVEHH